MPKESLGESDSVSEPISAMCVIRIKMIKRKYEAKITYHHIQAEDFRISYMIYIKMNIMNEIKSYEECVILPQGCTTYQLGLRANYFRNEFLIISVFGIPPLSSTWQNNWSFKWCPSKMFDFIIRLSKTLEIQYHLCLDDKLTTNCFRFYLFSFGEPFNYFFFEDFLRFQV